jgi:hypothetical protein
MRPIWEGIENGTTPLNSLTAEFAKATQPERYALALARRNAGGLR